MNSMNYLKTIAIFMICLVLTLPFYSANVFAAANVMSATTYGGSGVERYRKSVDTTRFEAVVGGEPVGAEYVYLESFSGGYKQQFTSCVDSDFGYNCVKTLELDTLIGGLYTYYIRSYDNPDGSGVAASTMITDIIVDDFKPIVNTFNSNFNNVGLLQEVRLSFDVSDTAVQGCSGFGKVELSVGNEDNIIETLPLNNVVGCSYLGNLTVVPGQHVAEGETNVMYYLKVYDRFDNPSDSKYLQVNVDSTAPSIVTSSFEVVTQVGEEPINYVKKGESTPVVIKFLVDGDVNSVNADLLDINPNYISLVDGSCQQIGYERFRCSWNAFINVGETTNAQITSRAYDDSGNFDEAVFPYTIFVDDSPPELSSLTTGYSYDDIIYAGKFTTYHALISESGVGLNLSKVYLDLGEINGRNNVMADNCTGAGTTWNCYWYDVETTTGEGYKQIALTGEDDGGNAFGKLGILVYADTIFPEIISKNYTSSSGYCPTTADMVTFEVGVIEAGPGLEFSVDVSDISTAVETVDGSCSLIEGEDGDGESVNEWKCTAIVGEIISGHFDGKVDFILTDGSNNTIEDVIETEICLLDNDSVEPNFFSLNEDPPEAVPAIVSRKGLSKYNYPVFVFPRLVASGVTEMLNFETSCVGAEIIDVLNERSTSPTLSLRLDQNDNTSDIEELSINCSFSIKLRSGNTVYLNPEIENFTVSFDLYDTSFGDVTEAMDDKIYNVKERLTTLDDRLETLHGWNNFFNIISSITKSLVNIAVTAGILLPIMYGVAWILWGVVYAGCCAGSLGIGCSGACFTAADTSASYAFWIPVGTALGWIFAGIEGLVWPLGLDINWIRIIFKGIVMLYSCRLCQYGIAGFEPYRSIHTAEICVCLPGMIYNWEKEKAINCIQLRCLQDSVEKGYPSSTCDDRKDQQQCLYVDSASWNKAVAKKGLGYIMRILGQIFVEVVSTLVILLLGTGWGMACKSFLGSGPIDKFKYNKFFVDPIGKNYISQQTFNLAFMACVATGSVIMATEMGDFENNKWDWESFGDKLVQFEFNEFGGSLWGQTHPCEGLDWTIDENAGNGGGGASADAGDDAHELTN